MKASQPWEAFLLRTPMHTGIEWGNCKACGTKLYLKRLKGRRPTYCDSCREGIQNHWRERQRQKYAEKGGYEKKEY